jgi:hypothetical protein
LLNYFRKDLVDEVIDDCSLIQNIRDAILATKLSADLATDPGKKHVRFFIYKIFLLLPWSVQDLIFDNSAKIAVPLSKI